MDISIERFNLNSGFMTFIAAVVALFVGIIAAGISIWNNLITQRGLRLQYQPDLVVKSENRQRIRFIVIENRGFRLGPDGGYAINDDNHRSEDEFSQTG